MILLMDNGSLEPTPTLALRRIASGLSAKLGEVVQPVSLLHSSAVPAEQLDGKPAEILEPALEKRLRAGTDDFTILPAFFGPSGALTDYLPRRVAALKTKFPSLRVRLAPPLANVAEPHDQRLATILEENVKETFATLSPPVPGLKISPPTVIVVDHGSPVPAVTAVRNHIAEQLRARLGPFAEKVIAASMERRPGNDYAFADPLLESVFTRNDLAPGCVIVALLFLSAGRHAGPGGDIEKICATAMSQNPHRRTAMTSPIGEHPLILEILAERARSALATSPL